MTPKCDPLSNSFISRQFASNSSEKAGSFIMDCRRGQLPNVQPSEEFEWKHDPMSETIVPRLFNIQDIDQRSGADFGAFRPLIHSSEGGYRMTFDEEILCRLVIPFQTAPSLTS
uniref:Uncharacterized protein n=1 Tax=Steinernema glaseri TaxID=37863 RepID=A0A1I7ZJF3_9BILA